MTESMEHAMAGHDHDIVIRGGTIVDGSGGEPFIGDVAIRGKTIAAVGKVAGSGAEAIDAAGRIVTPGFVNIHTHYDGQITWDSRLAPSSAHGITTVVMGNCGVGFAPDMKADINAVDLARLRLYPPSPVYDLPDGGRRLIQRADGYDVTIVSRQVTCRAGQPTGALPGRLVRGAQAAPAALQG